jgi:hypothetical protein
MLRLSDLQARFSAAILTGDKRLAASLVRDDEVGAAERIQIYRNHYMITLSDALAATFPVVRQLVGEACFRFLARGFVSQHSPSEPCLFAYGAKLPAFLAHHPTLQGFPYIADVAKLEWAMNQAAHALDERPTPSGALRGLTLSQIPQLTFVFHPSCRLVKSRFPIHEIWRAHQTTSPSLEAVDLSAGTVRLFVLRDVEGDVVWRQLCPAGSSFIRSLRGGRRFGPACDESRRRSAGFDPIALLSDLIRIGALVDASIY